MKALFTVGPFTVYPDRGRSKQDTMGRFGGGWNYKLGVTAGSRSLSGQLTVLVALWSREYRVVHKNKRERRHAHVR